ncbi:DNA adenine methylase [Janthinobacterium sp. SUN120]|nr:DNA adenine methylase [Janthinobacterium sp. SUN120]
MLERFLSELMSNLAEAISSLPSLATEYIGNKRALLDFVAGTIVDESGSGEKEILDLFSGTGVVSAAFKTLGYAVTANDHLSTCFNLTSAVLLNHTEPSFAGLSSSLVGRNSAVGPYEAILDHLNNLPLRPGGFAHKNFSPASAIEIETERRYFTEINAQKIDVVRDQIESWRPVLTDAEHALLISDLVRAVSAVSNVAGTFGCYLKQWKVRALNPLVLRPSGFVDGRRNGHSVLSMEAHDAVPQAKARIIYADPPYTKRQYAAYYHVLETIVRNDKPVLIGSTGLRNWETHASDFCYKRRAIGALDALLSVMDCEHFFLSYNEDGQMEHDQILDVLGGYGSVGFREMSLRRYKSSALPHKGPNVAERIYHLAVS